jgi:hypothetical protein
MPSREATPFTDVLPASFHRPFRSSRSVADVCVNRRASIVLEVGRPGGPGRVCAGWVRVIRVAVDADTVAACRERCPRPQRAPGSLTPTAIAADGVRAGFRPAILAPRLSPGPLGSEHATGISTLQIAAGSGVARFVSHCRLASVRHSGMDSRTRISGKAINPRQPVRSDNSALTIAFASGSRYCPHNTW